MMERLAQSSPRFLARLAGVSWVLCALTGTVALLARGGRLGFVANFIATICYVAATLLVYYLLKPVSRNLSLLAALSSLAGCAIGILNMFLSLGVRAYNITFLFGLHCFLVGYLILRSIFLPRFAGVLMVLAGLGWLTKSLGSLLSLPLGSSPYMLAPGILGEVSLALWLLVMGVNEQRWKQQAGLIGR
jgi:hypothetical protein